MIEDRWAFLREDVSTAKALGAPRFTFDTPTAAALLADRDRLAAQIEAVREMHQSVLLHGGNNICRECTHDMPCPTARAVANRSQSGHV